MHDSIKAIQLLLAEVYEHLQSGTKTGKIAAAAKLHRAAALATTLALTIGAKS